MIYLYIYKHIYCEDRLLPLVHILQCFPSVEEKNDSSPSFSSLHKCCLCIQCQKAICSNLTRGKEQRTELIKGWDGSNHIRSKQISAKRNHLAGNVEHILNA